jgi:hypothetical protein
MFKGNGACDPVANGRHPWHKAHMMGERRNRQQTAAVLRLADDVELRVADQRALREALAALEHLGSGQAAIIARGAKDYIKATRRADLWSVETRSGSWWTLRTFTADMTTDHSAREVRESRAAGSLGRRIVRAIGLPPPEHALSTAEVETLFVEYLLGLRFSIPISGA